MTGSADPTISLSALVAAAAGQLDTLGVRCRALQAAIGPTAAPEGAHALQDLDLITQTLEAMADFLADLSAAAPPGWRLDAGPALSRIPLADLAAALDPRAAGPATASGGDLELFL